MRPAAEARGINFRYFADGAIGISVDETTTGEDAAAIVAAFTDAVAGASDAAAERHAAAAPRTPDRPEAILPAGLLRTSAVPDPPGVQRASFRDEDDALHQGAGAASDVGLDTSMIPLGSCTMKLNAASEMLPVTLAGVLEDAPVRPGRTGRGLPPGVQRARTALCSITGFAAVSLQPNSGAQGEFAGLMTIRAYHRDRGEAGRDVVLIPSSAHGTNPASASMAGMKVVVVACDSNGNIDLDDLRARAAEHRDALAALMVTYPSTHGVFEEAIREICAIVHEHGGQVYMDGANMNAQVGLTSPAAIGADVCHLNLHKTFAIPHGGGGPGMGPIAVAAHLAPYLPGHPVVAGRRREGRFRRFRRRPGAAPASC